MLDNLKIRWALICLVFFSSVYFIFPTFEHYIFNTTSNLDNTIKLGLDLKGGLNIVLEIDEYTFLKKLAKKKLSKQSENQFRNLLKESFDKSVDNKSQIVDELASLSERKNIKLNKFFSNLSKSSDNNDIITEIKNQQVYAMKSILDVMRNRIVEHDQYGLGEPSIQQLGSNRLVVELAGISDVSRAKDYIQRTADFELSLLKKQDQFTDILLQMKQYVNSQSIIAPNLDSLMVPDNSSEGYVANEKDIKALKVFFSTEEITQLIKSNSKIVWGNDLIFSKNSNEKFRKAYLVSSNPAISSGMIQTPKAAVAEMGSDNAGQWIVNLDMTKEGRKKWSKFTGENINRQVAIILDDKVFMAPFIRDKISSGGTQISGFADMQEAKDIASVLKAGELPAPIKIIQTNYVGPSLGQDSINSGSFSMIIGLALVLIFMLLYYKASGIIANIALVINIIIIFAVLYTMNAVLTLPGIAGLLLTVGMSVDANVIIFERIKEEIKSGKTIYASVNNGYKKAFVTILDANITTLLTAFILSFIGSGPIKGFATTLSVGIFCSMFTAVFFTKTLFLTLLKKTTINKLSI
jgi:protein-export membrane protein SecD